MGGGEKKILRLPSVQAVQDVAPLGGYKNVSIVSIIDSLKSYCIFGTVCYLVLCKISFII